MSERAFKRVFLAGTALVLLLLLAFVLPRLLNPFYFAVDSGSERNFESDQARIEFLQYYLPVAIPRGAKRIKFEYNDWLDSDLKGTFNVPPDMLVDFITSLQEKCHVTGTTGRVSRFSFSKITIPPSRSDAGERADGEIEVDSDTGRTTISCATHHAGMPNGHGEKS